MAELRKEKKTSQAEILYLATSFETLSPLLNLSQIRQTQKLYSLLKLIIFSAFSYDRDHLL